MRYARFTLGGVRGIVAPALCGALLTLSSCRPANAADYFIDITNPTGIPDITQTQNPVINPGGICAAAAMANLLWNYSEVAPYNGLPRLVGHPNSAAPAQNWPGTWGNWAADSLVLRDRLAHWIYRDGIFFATGHGPAGGTTKYINERGHLYSNPIFGAGNPNGLSVRTYSGSQATYQNLYSWVLNAQNQQMDALVSTHWFWHNADGSTVQNNGNKSRHALGVAGVDRPNPGAGDAGHSRIYLTNGWGSQQANANPVNSAYYDRYDNIVTNGGPNNDRFRIPTGGGAHNNGQGNDYLVHGIANSNNADYVEMYEFVVVKRGGSPAVGLDITLTGGNENLFNYRIFNPEVTAQHHFFLEVDNSILAQLSLGDIISPSGWSVEYWNPAASITDPTGTKDGNDLFGAPFAVQGGSENLTWNPDWGGLHWYASSSADAIAIGQTLSGFGFRLPDTIAYTTDKVALTVVGELGNEVHYFNMIGGPVAAAAPEPGTFALLIAAVGGWAIRARRRKP